MSASLRNRGTGLLVWLVAAAVALAGTLTLGAVAPAAAKAKGCKGASSKPSKLSPKRIERATVCLIKKKRKQHRAGSIRSQGDLAKASIRHTRVMKRTGCFAHQCAGEPPTGTRIARTGYFRNAKSYAYGEVIGWGKGRRGSPKNMVNAWMHSSSHRSTLLGRRFNHLGVGFAARKPGGARGGGTYTVDFGHRRR